MVDREARRRLAQKLRHLVTGRIENAEFTAAHPGHTPDRALVAIWKSGWCLYSDARVYRLRGPREVSKEARQTAARAILFLTTDLEYEWPDLPDVRRSELTLSVAGCLLMVVGCIVIALVGRIAGLVVFGLGLWLLALSSWLFRPRGPLARRALQRYRRSGDHDVWPFLRRADFERARRPSHSTGRAR